MENQMRLMAVLATILSLAATPSYADGLCGGLVRLKAPKLDVQEGLRVCREYVERQFAEYTVIPQSEIQADFRTKAENALVTTICEFVQPLSQVLIVYVVHHDDRKVACDLSQEVGSRLMSKPTS
jgi:hypothetical protein